MAKRKRVSIKDTPLLHCASVRQYEATPQWRAQSVALLNDHTLCCDICGRARFKWMTRGKNKGTWKRMLRFNVHHIRYNTVPNETREDFMLLCQNCHDQCHKIIRDRNISPMYEQLAQIVSRFFFYDGIKTFKEW